MTIQYVIHTYSSYVKQANGTPFDFHITHLFRIKVKLAQGSNDLKHRLSPSPFGISLASRSDGPEFTHQKKHSGAF